MTPETAQYCPVIPMEHAQSQALRRLHIEHLPFSNATPLNTLFTWSNLQHLSMLETKIDIRLWFRLIRSCTSLRSADIHINLSDVGGSLANDTSLMIIPPIISLPNLRKLHLTLEDGRERVRSIFVNLYFPRLIAFRLTSGHMPMVDLHRILSATPALVELQLFGINPTMSRGYRVVIPEPDHTKDPLWKYVPNLERLFLDSSTVINHLIPVWLGEVFRSGWLRLGMGTNRIKRLELGLANPCECAEVGLGIPYVNANLPAWTVGEISRDRSCAIFELSERLVETCGLEGVKIVVREPTTPRVWSGLLLKEDENPSFDVQGFSQSY